MPPTFVLRTRQLVHLDLETTFAFFADAGNLQRITPPWLNFAVTTPLPIEMRVGARIDYRLALHGIPFRWQTRITEWDPPHSFVDEQIRGPYRLWRHRHVFSARDEATQVEDEVRYQVVGGRLVNVLVRRDLARIFGYRQAALGEALNVPRGPASIAFEL
jgi:ligand-binding SRPBCC domain-containing protein